MVAEGLSLQGYLVETNVRLIGNREADVIGVKLENDRLEIKHVECAVQVAQKPSGEELERILGKFKREYVEAVKKIVQSRLGAKPGEIKYDKLLIAVYIEKEAEWRKRLEENEINLLTFRDLIFEVVKAIDEWKKKRREDGLIKGETLEFPWITLPACYWILYLIDVLKSPQINLLKLNSREKSYKKKA